MSEAKRDGREAMTADAREAIVRSGYAMDIEAIREFLPHRYPFLLVDRVLSVEPQGDLKNLEGVEGKLGSKATAIKNVTFNEPCFNGHFPHYSIFPGVLQIEAMAQAASFVAYPFVLANGLEKSGAVEVILLGVDGVRFRKPVRPGDQIRLEATLTRCRGSLWGFKCVATVDGQKAAEAELLASLKLGGKGV